MSTSNDMKMDIMHILPVSMYPYLEEIKTNLATARDQEVNESTNLIVIAHLLYQMGSESYIQQKRAEWELYPESVIRTFGQIISIRFGIPLQVTMSLHEKAIQGGKTVYSFFQEVEKEGLLILRDAFHGKDPLALFEMNTALHSCFKEYYNETLSQELKICKAFSAHVKSMRQEVEAEMMEKVAQVEGLMEKMESLGDVIESFQSDLFDRVKRRMTQPDRGLYMLLILETLEAQSITDEATRAFLIDYTKDASYEDLILTTA